MSLSSKIVLGLSSVFTVSTVTYVHFWQKAESDRISANVRREIELERQANRLNLPTKPHLYQQLTPLRILANTSILGIIL